MQERPSRRGRPVTRVVAAPQHLSVRRTARSTYYVAPAWLPRCRTTMPFQGLRKLAVPVSHVPNQLELRRAAYPTSFTRRRNECGDGTIRGSVSCRYSPECKNLDWQTPSPRPPPVGSSDTSGLSTTAPLGPFFFRHSRGELGHSTKGPAGSAGPISAPCRTDEAGARRQYRGVH
jgi:hypothetical protein